jgi:ATP-dependent helicase/nuclease subunit A
LKAEEKAEEDRLLYVAMTRAEDRLVLSYARTKRNSPWQKLAEAGIHAETTEDRAREVYAAATGLKTAEHVEKVEKLLDAPVLRGQHDSSARVTDVAQFDACPRKYYLGRYLGLMPEPTGPGTGAIELGLEVHKALAQHVALAQQTAVQRAELRATLSSEALDLTERFDASDLGQRLARASRVEREFDFLLALEDVVLRGQIDLWFEEGGELILVDYKTDRDESGAVEYALQLRLYALALERYAGRLPDRAALCFLRSGRVVDVSLAWGDLEVSRNAVRALAAAQDALEFPMKIGEHCRRCPFFEGLCPAKFS